MLEEKQCNKCHRVLPIDSFYTNGKTPKGTQKYKGKCKQCEMKHNKERFYTKLRKILGTELECAKCGYSKCLAALEFHHLDGSTKESTISNLRNRSEEVLKLEVEKCVLLCANCHREAHHTLLP